jgi:hypothetical protein
MDILSTVANKLLNGEPYFKYVRNILMFAILVSISATIYRILFPCYFSPSSITYLTLVNYITSGEMILQIFFTVVIAIVLEILTSIIFFSMTELRSIKKASKISEEKYNRNYYIRNGIDFSSAIYSAFKINVYELTGKDRTVDILNALGEHLQIFDPNNNEEISAFFNELKDVVMKNMKLLFMIAIELWVIYSNDIISLLVTSIVLAILLSTYILFSHIYILLEIIPKHMLMIRKHFGTKSQFEIGNSI